MKILFDLANEAGFFPSSVSCDGLIPQSFGDVVKITTTEHLVMIENSKCTTFSANVDVDIDIEGLLPPKHRTLQALDRVTTIEGRLRFGENPFLTSPELRGLKRVGTIKPPSARTLVANSFQYKPEFRKLYFALEEVDVLEASIGLEFPSVKRIGSLALSGMTDHVFPSLLEANSIFISRFSGTQVRPSPNTDLFPELKKVKWMAIEGGSSYIFNGLRNLEEMESFRSESDVEIHFESLKTLKEIVVEDRTFTGSFAALESVDNVQMNVSSYPFPKLKRVTNHFQMGGRGGPTLPSILEEVGGVFEIAGMQTGFNKLVSVGSTAVVSCSQNVQWEGLNALTSFHSLSISVGDCAIGGFEDIVEIDRVIEVSVRKDGSFTGLTNLEVAGSLVYEDVSATPALFPKLETVQSLRVMTEISGDLAGFESLKLIESSLSMRSAATISGFDKLEAVGGDIVFAKQMSTAVQDEFLARLPTFSGNISINSLN